MLSAVMLACWWLVDILIDQIEYRVGHSWSWISGAGFVLLIAASAVVDLDSLLFTMAAVLIALGFSYHAIYWLRIRR